MYRTIVVPLDGSPFGEHALPLALAVARRAGAQLHLVHGPVVGDVWAAESGRDAEGRARARAYLAAVAGRLAATWRGQVETALLDGPVAEAVADYAEARRADLVVMTTHGRGAISRAWLGSVADRLIRRLSMPMLIVRPHADEPADLAGPPGLGHVLIPLDGSELAETALPHALAMGALTGASYSLIQNIEVPITDYSYGGYAISAREIDAWSEEARRYLERVADGMRAEGLTVRTEVILGWAAQTILDYARDNGADLIAMATHGRSGAARFFLGSVADKVVRGASVPVLLHRPPGATHAG